VITAFELCCQGGTSPDKPAVLGQPHILDVCVWLEDHPNLMMYGQV